MFFSSNIILEVYDLTDKLMSDIDVNEVYLTIITEDQGLSLTLANMSSMSQVNQAN